MINHSCYIPTKDLPYGVQMVTEKIRCVICGQRWQVVWHGVGSSEARRIRTWYPNIRLYLWRREMKRQFNGA